MINQTSSRQVLLLFTGLLLFGSLCGQSGSFVPVAWLPEPDQLFYPRPDSILITWGWEDQHLGQVPPNVEYQLTIWSLNDTISNLSEALDRGIAEMVFQSDFSPENGYIIYDSLLIITWDNDYLYQIQATDPDSIVQFDNEGYSDYYRFYYGYLTQGEILLVYPSHPAGKFDSKGRVITWLPPHDVLVPGTWVDYRIEFAEYTAGQNLESVFEESLVYSNNFYSNRTYTLGISIRDFGLKANQLYAWRVIGVVETPEEEIEIARSGIWTFQGPNLTNLIRAVSELIFIDSCNTDLENFYFEGTYRKYYDSIENQFVHGEISGSNLQLVNNGGYYYIDGGEAVASLDTILNFTIPAQYNHSPLADSIHFAVDSVIFNRNGKFHNGIISFDFSDTYVEKREKNIEDYRGDLFGNIVFDKSYAVHYPDFGIVINSNPGMKWYVNESYQLWFEGTFKSDPEIYTNLGFKTERSYYRIEDATFILLEDLQVFDDRWNDQIHLSFSSAVLDNNLELGFAQFEKNLKGVFGKNLYMVIDSGAVTDDNSITFLETQFFYDDPEVANQITIHAHDGKVNLNFKVPLDSSKELMWNHHYAMPTSVELTSDESQYQLNVQGKVLIALDINDTVLFESDLSFNGRSLHSFMKNGEKTHFGAPYFTETEPRSDGIEVVWIPVENSAFYEINVQTGSETILNEQLDSESTSYKITTLSSDSAYTLGMLAHFSDGSLDSSYRFSFRTLGTPPISPSEVTAQRKKEGVLIIWEDNSIDEDSFKIERGIEGLSSFSSLAIVGPDTIQYLDRAFNRAINYEYRVQSINKWGASEFVEAQVILGAVAATQDMVIYPNPTNDHFQIQTSFHRRQIYKVILYDLTGRVLFRTNNKLEHVNEQLIDQTSQLASGTYLMDVQVRYRGRKTFKILKR